MLCHIVVEIHLKINKNKDVIGNRVKSKIKLLYYLDLCLLKLCNNLNKI